MVHVYITFAKNEDEEGPHSIFDRSASVCLQLKLIHHRRHADHADYDADHDYNHADHDDHEDYEKRVGEQTFGSQTDAGASLCTKACS